MKSAAVILTMSISLGWIVLDSTPKEMDLAREHIQHIFPEATTIDRHTFRISAAAADSARGLSKQLWNGNGIEVLIPIANDAALGYAVIDNVKGKDELITYVVMVTPELTVKGVEILAYRESYGGEVRHSSWLQQFINKQPTDKLRPGKDIRNITGATISARSLTLGVGKVLSLLHVLKDQLPHSLGSTH